MGTEKPSYTNADLLVINQSSGGNFFITVFFGHFITDDFCHLRQTDADLVFQKFTNTAYTPVTQVVNIVYFKGKIFI